MEKYYIVYKITNIVNNKIYIGKHETYDLDDNYFGSGKYLKRAISKYGIKNFTKEILFIYDNELNMNDKEAQLVSEEFVAREDTYNLCLGGKGGFSYINSNGLNKNESLSTSNISRDKLSKSLKEKYKSDLIYKSKHIIKSANARDIQKIKYPNGLFHGKSHTAETKDKIGSANSIIQSGTGNSQYGTNWIHNLDLKKSKKMKKEDRVPEGWLLGRKINFNI